LSLVVEAVEAEQQPVVVLEVYKYHLMYLFLETQLILLQLVQEELQVLMEILVVQEIIQ
tara:strand:+ start:165 stop:341 length:177 start_codon:yes stop_codon:yes gene_type:complete